MLLSHLARVLPPAVAARRKLGLQYPERMLLAEPNRTHFRALLLDAATPGGLFRREVLEPLLRRHLARPGEGGRLVWMLVVLATWWEACGIA